MRLMMFDEQDSARIDAQRVADPILHPQLVEQPRRHRLPENAYGLWNFGEGRLQDPIELHEWFFEEGDVVQVLPANARFIETELDRARGKPEIVFHAGEALLLGSRQQRPVPEDRCGRIVEIAGNPENVHQNCRRACSIAIGPDSVRLFHSGRAAPRRPVRRINPIGTTTIQYSTVRMTSDWISAAMREAFPALPQ